VDGQAFSKAGSSGDTVAQRIRAAVKLLPQGRTLPAEAWASRHKALLFVLWAHVLLLPVFSIARGKGVTSSIAAIAVVALAGGAASLKGAGRRARSMAVVFGLLSSSAILVNAWDGQIEAHFHFFVMIAVLALYEDWLPFGFAIAYVVAEHGVLGAISRDSVYNHPGNPWLWAGVHGLFVLGSVAASVVTWRLNEEMRGRMGEANDRARETTEQFRLAFESGASGMALSAPDGHFIKVNEALCEMVGYPEEELLQRDFQSITHPDDLYGDLAQQRALLEGATDVYETEKRYVHSDGHEVWVRLGVSAAREADGSVRYFIAQTIDVTERRRFEAELSHRALHDPLTNLPNRALFMDRLTHALQRLRREPGELAVLFIDLDRFKLVNDSMGHSAGDSVLTAAAKRLAVATRAGDTLARFGGDEFAVLCEGAGVEEARRVAQRIVDEFQTPFDQEGREFNLSLSVGVRVSDAASADSPDTLLRDADVALYAVKGAGRGDYQLFDPRSQLTNTDRLAVEHAIRLGLQREEFILQYQPEVDLASQRIVAVEALIRWQHPERGLVPPGDFIPVAEETDLIVPMGEWVLREACSQLASWRASGTADEALRVAVNVSARQLSDPGLPRTVGDALGSAGLEPDALCLEITESAVVHDTAIVHSNLDALKELGVGLALDDFGVGFSSLSQIRALPPVDVIKLDRSFTSGLGTNESDTAVVMAVLNLARSLGLKAVAEGIETEAQLGRLIAEGCDIGQGFHFARPQDPSDIARLLAENAREAQAVEVGGDGGA
jgi:diguanylate cyclase (GGDEF)-like protein/PAS domain S-box-containing protein